MILALGSFYNFGILLGELDNSEITQERKDEGQ
jgi:hypothetical protein